MPSKVWLPQSRPEDLANRVLTPEDAQKARETYARMVQAEAARRAAAKPPGGSGGYRPR